MVASGKAMLSATHHAALAMPDRCRWLAADPFIIHAAAHPAPPRCDDEGRARPWPLMMPHHLAWVGTSRPR